MTGGSSENEPGVSEGTDTAEAEEAAPVGYLLTIGDIGVTPEWVVTPNGNAPVGGSQWIVTDMTRTESKIPAWAIVCAILFTLACLLGLFFLLAKEQKTTGYVEVAVRSEKLYHKTQIPVSDPVQIQQVRTLVSRAQAIAAQGR